MVKSILELDNNKALDYFMSAENYFTLNLPQYITFQPMLDFVRNVIDNKLYKECRFGTCHASDFDDVNYKLLSNKDSNYSYRPLTIANPYLYYFTVKLITERDNWEIIKKRFKLFSNENLEVSSIPLYKDDKKNIRSAQIKQWWGNLEQRTIELSLEYKYMFKTDISNCYPSIYTHAVDWAITGKKESKEQKHNKNRLGSKLDSFLQGLQYGQTNGIPQGSTLFDFIAELVLGFCDYELTQGLTEKGISNYKILRYRDDYRIFSNSKEELEKIIMLLQNVLSELNFQMNSSKTLLTEKIVRDAIKNDKLDYFQCAPLYKEAKSDDELDITCVYDSYYKELYFILLFAEKHPNSGIVLNLLSNFNKRISKKEEIYSNIKVMIALVVDITLLCVRAHDVSMSIISHLLKHIDDSSQKEKIISNVKKRFQQIPNTGAVQIWLQRITHKLDLKELISYDEPICQLVAGEDVNLWNFNWLKPELYSEFPYESICDWEELEKMTPYITPTEVECFDPYHWNRCYVYSNNEEETDDLPF